MAQPKKSKKNPKKPRVPSTVKVTFVFAVDINGAVWTRVLEWSRHKNKRPSREALENEAADLARDIGCFAEYFFQDATFPRPKLEGLEPLPEVHFWDRVARTMTRDEATELNLARKRKKAAAAALKA